MRLRYLEEEFDNPAPVLTWPMQPIGWNPDLDDGVRLNIRPFVIPAVLRSKFTIHWNKDRGRNPDGSERINDLHYTTAEKRAAKEARA